MGRVSPSRIISAWIRGGFGACLRSSCYFFYFYSQPTHSTHPPELVLTLRGGACEVAPSMFSGLLLLAFPALIQMTVLYWVAV